MMLGLGNELRKSGAPSAPFSVDTLSEVVTWLRAEDNVTTDSGGVARWRDKVGTADWVSNESGRQPELVGSGVSARIRFDGNDRLYQKDYAWSGDSGDGQAFDFPHDQFDVMNVGGSGGFHIFMVWEVSQQLAQTAHTILAENHFVDDGTPGAPFTARTDIVGVIKAFTKGDFISVQGIDGSKVSFNSTTSAGTEFPLATANETALDGTSKFLLTIEYAGGTNGEISIRVNGVNKPLTNNTTGTLGEVTVGEMGASMKADVYELINCSSKLSSDNRELVESYLMDRHSIS